MFRRWIGVSTAAVLMSVTMLATESVALADAASDGVCSTNSSSTGGRTDELGALIHTFNDTNGNHMSSHKDCGFLGAGCWDWGRIGSDALSLGEGLVIGAVTAIAAVAAVSFLVATFPAWGTAIVIGATVVGVGLLAYGVYDTVSNWNKYSESQKFFVAGNWIGGIVGGMGPGAALGRSIGEGGAGALGRAFPGITRIAPMPPVEVAPVPADVVASGKSVASEFPPDPKNPPVQPGPNTLDNIKALGAEAKPGFDNMINEVAAKTGGEGQTTGLKGDPRIIEKASGKDYITDSGDPGFNRVVDVTRGQIVYDTPDQAYAGLAEMKNEGVDIVRVKDRFSKPGPDGYRDILVNVRNPNGSISEVQLQVRSMLEAKNSPLGHDVYNQMRTIMDGRDYADLSPGERAQVDALNQQMRGVYDPAWSQAQQYGTQGFKPGTAPSGQTSVPVNPGLAANPQPTP